MLQPICILLLVFFSFLKPAFAIPTVKIEQINNPVIIGEQIIIPFTVVNNGIGGNYHYKIIGIGVDLDNLPDIGCNSRYDSCPVLSVGTSETIQSSLNFKINNGQGGIKVRIAEADIHSNTKDSNEISLNIIFPTETPTPLPTLTPFLTPTLIPTDTPFPSNTPIPTITKSPTSTPKPTSTPTPKITSTPTFVPTPTLKPTNTPIPSSTPILTPTKTLSPIPTMESLITIEPTEEILGVTDIPTIEPTETNKKDEKEKNNYLVNFIPTILIILGALLLFTPLILSKIKHCPKKILKK